jgi:adenylate cyclase
MRIACSYRGRPRVHTTSEKEFVFGRAEAKFAIGLDLSPDPKVSRLHGRIWYERRAWWLEDLDSSHGTRLNDREIKGCGKQELSLNDVILAGETTMRVESLEASQVSAPTSYLEAGAALPSHEKGVGAAGLSITNDVDANQVSLGPLPGTGDETARRLGLICDLPLQFSTKSTLDLLLPAVVASLCQLFPKVESWALVLREANTGNLLLKAYNSSRQPYLSETLARRAITEQRAFVWRRNVESDISKSVMQNAIDLGMYAPLAWQNEVVGVICGGAISGETGFTDEDLRLLVVVAQYAAMAVATHRLQSLLKKEWTAKANLMRQFSPKVAERLLTLRGRLRLGGERSEVTILNADIRGFTNLAHEMDPDEVVHLLNEYFAAVVPVIFARNGTIDKYMGDAILAVFGSPESDPEQHENAVLAAEEMQAAVAKLNLDRQRRGEPCREFGIGVHCGEVVHGFVGTSDRMEFTVIGDVVNRTARYCSAAEGGQVLVSAEMYERVWKVADTEKVTIKTKHEGDFVAYRVKSIKDSFKGNKSVEKV